MSRTGVSSNIKSGDWSGGKGILPGRETLGPILLMTITPAFSIIFFYVCSSLNGNFLSFINMCYEQGLFRTIYNIWPSAGDVLVWEMILGFMALQVFLMRFMPGKEFRATVTAGGNVPIYKANGMACYLTTVFLLLVMTYFDVIRPAIVYDKMGQILSSMNLFAFAFCIMLLIKGHVAPTNSDSGSTGSVVMDFYWGMELHPRFCGWFDLKMFTNCRCGMMFWAVAIICFAHKNMELNNNVISIGMTVSVILQLIYITKFFYWEMGYMNSMDIQHDRAGYYICWGCLVWVPSVYTSQSFYLAASAPDISPLTGLLIFLCGILMIWINFDSDNQRYIFRQSEGECKIWGRKPKRIVAEYTIASTGESKKSLLLVDGWWKVSRHFHYVPEVLASLCWGLPALNTALVGPYFYTFYLTILLVDRAFRDDDRCRKKYGTYWLKYCNEVPYMIVPLIV